GVCGWGGREIEGGGALIGDREGGGGCAVPVGESGPADILAVAGCAGGPVDEVSGLKDVQDEGVVAGVFGEGGVAARTDDGAASEGGGTADAGGPGDEVVGDVVHGDEFGGGFAGAAGVS